MDDTEKKVLKIIATITILFFAAFLILYIMHEQSWTYNFHNGLAMGFISVSSGSLALMLSCLLYLIYKISQPDILFTVLIVMGVVFIIVLYSLRLYLSYYRFKRRKRAASQRLPRLEKTDTARTRRMGFGYRIGGMIIGIFTIIFAAYNIWFEFYLYSSQSLVAALSVFSIFPDSTMHFGFKFIMLITYYQFNPVLVNVEIICVATLVSAVGLLSTTRYGYYAALLSSFLLIRITIDPFSFDYLYFFPFATPYFFTIQFGGSILVIITIIYIVFALRDYARHQTLK